MRDKIHICFKYDNDYSFMLSQIIEVKAQLYGDNKNFQIRVPLVIIYGTLEHNFWWSDDKKELFTNDYYFTIKNINQLEKYRKSFNVNNADKWLIEHFKEDKLVEQLINKGLQWIDNTILEPTQIDSKETYVCGDEFIQVDENTSFGGNFEQFGIEGCHMKFGKNQHCKEFTNLSFKPHISEYTLSRINHKFYKELRDEGITLYDKSDKEIIDIIVSKFGLGVLLEAYKRELGQNHNHSIDEHYQPYKVYLAGNDDASYTKYFSTEEDMMVEVYRLRRCQPINMDIDVVNNGYYFTN